MTDKASKWMKIVVKDCIRAVNSSNLLRMAEMFRNGRKFIGNIRKFYVEYWCHVQSYAAAALA